MLSSIVGMACSETAFVWMLDSRNLRLKDSSRRSGCYITLVGLPILYTCFPVVAWAESPFGKHSSFWYDDSAEPDTSLLGISTTMLADESADGASNDCQSLVTLPLRARSIFPIFVGTIVALPLAELISLQLPYSKKLFQYTNSRLTDFDQIAAIIGGTTVLFFNLHSVVRYWYGWRKDMIREATDTADTGGMALSVVWTQYRVDPDSERGPPADTVSGVDAAANLHLPPASQPGSEPKRATKRATEGAPKR